MKPKSLLILIVVVVIGATAYYLGFNPQRGKTDDYLIPGLSARLNDVTGLTIHAAGNVLLTAVSKSENNWIVENRDGYEADMEAVRTAFNNLAEARLIEVKTSNPDNYTRLGVADISDTNTRGVQFSVQGLGEPISIIAGENDATRKNTQYIRRAGEQQSWLIDKDLDFKGDVTRWLRKDILDIPPQRIKSIRIRRAGDVDVLIENAGSEEYEFMLSSPVPEGGKVSESELYQVANALSSLQIRDVVALENLEADMVEPVIATFVTYNGITFTARSFSVLDETYSTFSIEFNADGVGQPPSSTEAEAGEAERLARTMIPRLRGWAFVLPTITRDALIKKPEDFILGEST